MGVECEQTLVSEPLNPKLEFKVQRSGAENEFENVEAETLKFEPDTTRAAVVNDYWLPTYDFSFTKSNNSIPAI